MFIGDLVELGGVRHALMPHQLVNLMSHKRLALPSRLVLAALLAGLSLAGCNQGGGGPANTAANEADAAPIGALPPVSEDVALAPAPAASALPPAPPPRLGRIASSYDAYAFADRAAEMSRAFADAPPDYTYDDDGVRPSVWRTRDGYVRVVEPVPGGERYYYYEPGSDEPFYVQDPDYGYGFDGGVLVVIYDRSGREMAPDAERADWAGRYLLRARRVYAGAQRQPHEAVSANNWRSERDAIAAQDRDWAAQQQQDADWRAYHDAHDAQDQSHWEAERLQRMTWAAHVDQAIDGPARAARDWQAAQAEAQAVGRPPPPPLAMNGHGGPPTPPAAQPTTAGPPPAGIVGRQFPLAQAPAANSGHFANQPPAGAQGGVDAQAAAARAAARTAAAEAATAQTAAAEQAAAARAAAAKAQFAQQQAAAQANLARQQASAAQADAALRARAVQAQAAREAQQAASAAQAQANLARQQQAAAAQAREAHDQAAARALASHNAQVPAQGPPAAAGAAAAHPAPAAPPPPQGQTGSTGAPRRLHHAPPASNAVDGKAVQ